MKAPRVLRLPLLLLSLSLLLVGSRAARAADADASPVEKAKRLLREAKDDYSAGRYEQSRVKLDEACNLVHTPNCVHNLAMAELRAGRPLDAYKHFREAFAVPTATWMQSDEAVSDARKMMAEAYAAVGHVQIRAPEGALVSVDGTPVDRTAGPVDVAPGSHVVEARLGPQIGRVQVEARPGAVDTVTLGLEAQSTAAPGVTGPTAGGAPVHDGSAASSTAEPAPATAGTLPQDRTEAAGGPRPWWTTRRWIGVAAVGVGAVSFVLDGVFYGQAKSAPDAPTHNTYAALTIATVGVGAIGVAGGALLVLWPDGAPRTSVVPVVSPAYGGLLLRRAF
jgi:hypothetical protein